jgi:hypothetical protein
LVVVREVNVVDAIGAEVTNEVDARRARSRSGLGSRDVSRDVPDVFAEREETVAARALGVH